MSLPDVYLPEGCLTGSAAGLCQLCSELIDTCSSAKVGHTAWKHAKGVIAKMCEMYNGSRPLYSGTVTNITGTYLGAISS